jgi:hypothetical protein
MLELGQRSLHVELAYFDLVGIVLRHPFIDAASIAAAAAPFFRFVGFGLWRLNCLHAHAVGAVAAIGFALLGKIRDHLRVDLPEGEALGDPALEAFEVEAAAACVVAAFEEHVGLRTKNAFFLRRCGQRHSGILFTHPSAILFNFIITHLTKIKITFSHRSWLLI